MNHVWGLPCRCPELQGCGQGGFLPQKLDESFGRYGRQRGPAPWRTMADVFLFFGPIGAEDS